MSDIDEREHRASERTLLRAILGLLLTTIIGGGIWVGTIQTKVSRNEGDLRAEVAAREKAVRDERTERTAAITAQWSEINALAERQRAAETTAARAEQRMIAIEQSSLRIERSVDALADRLDRLLERYARPGGQPAQ